MNLYKVPQKVSHLLSHPETLSETVNVPTNKMSGLNTANFFKGRSNNAFEVSITIYSIWLFYNNKYGIILCGDQNV